MERWGDTLVDGQALRSGKKWELEWSFVGNVKAETQTQQRKMPPPLGKQENKMHEMSWNWVGGGGLARFLKEAEPH